MPPAHHLLLQDHPHHQKFLHQLLLGHLSPLHQYCSVKAPDHDNLKEFLGALGSCSSKPAILSLVEPYSYKYIPKTLNSTLPVCFTELFKPEYLELNYGELLKLA